jgi:hypothetical protein
LKTKPFFLSHQRTVNETLLGLYKNEVINNMTSEADFCEEEMDRINLDRLLEIVQGGGEGSWRRRCDTDTAGDEEERQFNPQEENRDAQDNVPAAKNFFRGYILNLESVEILTKDDLRRLIFIFIFIFICII